MTRATIFLTSILTVMSVGAIADTTWEETRAGEPTSFTELDVNGDGKLDEAEVVDAQDPNTVGGVDFDDIDENGDGEISNDEWDQYLRD